MVDDDKAEDAGIVDPFSGSLFAQLIAPLVGETKKPAALKKRVLPNVVDGVRKGPPVSIPVPVTQDISAEEPIAVVAHDPQSLDPHLLQAFQICVNRDFRADRIPNKVIEKLLPDHLQSSFRYVMQSIDQRRVAGLTRSNLSDELYHAVKDIIQQCPSSTQSVSMDEIHGININGQTVDVNMQSRFARQQIAHVLRTKRIKREDCIRQLKTHGLGDERFTNLIERWISNTFVLRRDVAELLVAIDRHVDVLPVKRRTSQPISDVAHSVMQTPQTDYRKLRPLAVEFRNVVYLENQRTAVDMNQISGVLPQSLRQVFNSFVDAGGMAKGGELEMTQELLQVTKSIYAMLPRWEDPALVREISGIPVGQGHIDPLMSINTARRQLRTFIESADPQVNTHVKQNLLTKGFAESDVDLVLERKLKGAYSVSRALVANILLAVEEYQPQ